MSEFTKADTTRRTRSSRLLVLVAAAALSLAFSSGCKKAAPPQTEVAVQAEHPRQGPISEQITADAVLAPIAQAAIEPRISAPVKKFYVQRGQKVRAGELLVTLEDADLAAAAMENKGSLEAAQAAYDSQTKAQVPEETLKAESDVAAARANLKLNESIVESRKQLFADGAIPGRDLDTAQAALVQAQATYDAAAKHLESLRSVSREAALKAAQGQLTSAEGKYKGAEAQVNFSEIRSPINGVVTERSLFDGETAQAGAPLITVMDTSVLLAKTHIAHSLAQQLKVGDAASVGVPGLTDPVPAKVFMVSPALDPGSTTVEVWVKIDNKPGKLKVGAPVKISIVGTTIAQAWKVPDSAIVTADDGAKSVLVVGSDGAAHRKSVTLGIDDGKDVQIVSGVAPTDLVITVAPYGLDEGTKVQVSAAAPADGGE
jgi:multidrug efflux pump subunit AcrA (membrane-fusion protein)